MRKVFDHHVQGAEAASQLIALLALGFGQLQPVP